MEVVFGAVVARTLVLGLGVNEAVDGLDNGFDAAVVVVGTVVFFSVDDVFETNGFCEVFVVVVLVLEIVDSTFLAAGFLEAKVTAVTAATAAAPATAISTT